MEFQLAELFTNNKPESNSVMDMGDPSAASQLQNLWGNLIGHPINNIVSSKTPQEAALRTGATAAELGMKLGTALLGYSPEAEGAIFPKGSQIGGAVRGNLMSLYKDDPVLGKYFSNQFGRVDDPVWEYLSKNGTESEKVQYLMKLNRDFTPGGRFTQLETDKIGSNVINQDIATQKPFLFASDGSENILQQLRDAYKNVKTIHYNAPTPHPDLKMAQEALEDIGKNYRGSSIIDRFNKGLIAAKNKYSRETTPYYTITDEKNLPVANIVQLKTRDSLRNEGNWMDHSVGGYADDPDYSLGGGLDSIKDGTVQIYSARHPKTGKPLLTFEVDGKSGDIVQIKKASNGTNFNSLDESIIDSFIGKTGFNIVDHPVYGAWEQITNYLPASIRTKYKDRMKSRDVDYYPEESYDEGAHLEEMERLANARFDDITRRFVEGGRNEIDTQDNIQLYEELTRRGINNQQDQELLREVIESLEQKLNRLYRHHPYYGDMSLSDLIHEYRIDNEPPF